MLLKRKTIKYFYDKHISNDQVYLGYKTFNCYHKMMALFMVVYEIFD